MSGGRRRAERAPGSGRVLPVLALAAGSVVAAAAWLFLVRAAIDFGRAARSGQGASGWAFTVGASLGAVVCLLLLFTLASRLRAVLRSAPPRVAGGRHR